jgi:hypothetical protein
MKTSHAKTEAFKRSSNGKRPNSLGYCETGTASPSRRARIKWMRSTRRNEIWNRNDRESNLLRGEGCIATDSRPQLWNLHQCDEAISPKRLAAVPRALRCISARRLPIGISGRDRSFGEILVDAA